MYNYVTSFLAGKVGGTANVGTGLANIKNGDLFIINAESGAILTGTGNTITTAPVIALVGCIEDGKPMVSGPIYGKALKGGGLSVYAAATVLKKAFGYSTVNTTATIPTVTKETTFNGAVVLKDELRLVPNKQPRLDFNVVSSVII